MPALKEPYTPIYQLLLTDNDFWRASNSLQLDETIGLYVARLLGTAWTPGLINNRHPLVPLSTMRAGFRLVLHGLATEMQHALLVQYKRSQARQRADAGATQAQQDQLQCVHRRGNPMNKPTTACISFAIIAALALAACSREPTPPPKAAQEAPAPAQPTETNIKTFDMGEFTGIALRDGGLDFPNDNKVFGIGKTPEEVAQLLTAAGLPTDKLSLNIQPLLVETKQRVLLFDTGAGANFGPSAGGLTTAMAEANVDAGSVTDVFISHPHGDHVGGLVNAEGALAFPNATIHIAAADWAFLKGLNAETAPKLGLSKHEALIAAMTPKVATFEPGAELIPGAVKAVEIRGHTPGHSGYLIGSGNSSLLYIADSMHHHVVSVQKPDWTIAFDGDAPTAQKSRKDLIAQSAASGQRIYAVHFPYPGLGKFEQRSDDYVWVAE